MPKSNRALWGASFLALLIFFSLAAGPVRAQEGSAAVLVSLDADSTYVNGILQILANRGGLNIVTSPEVQRRKISIHLRNTPFDEALNLVVRAAGLGYERVGNSILVGDVEKLSTPTGLVTRVFELQYANASEVKTMLEVLSKDVSANVIGNLLMIHASQSIVDEAATIIEQLDRKPQQVMLEARLVEVNTSDVKELGVDWEKITKWNSVLTEGNQGASAQGQLPANLGYFKTGETADMYRQASAFQLTLDALITDGAARLLANTKIVTLNGKPAQIFAGETVPVVITSLQSGAAAGGTLQTVQLEKIDVGVKLSITPFIGDGVFVTALVEPEVSRIVRFIGRDSDLPQTATRRAKSLVRVRDGEKIYLGGLLSEEKRRTMKKVPLLGDIPFLGYLFRHYKDDNSQVDLVIEITPHIVGDEGAMLPIAPQSPVQSGGK